MEIRINQRPWALPAASAPMSAVRVILAAGELSVARVHQVQVQAELTLVPAYAPVDTTNGFTGKGLQSSKRGMDVRGVPPRGRPV
ncbi:MAG TPA: hypothetical protein VGD43_23740 [Micromonospora sp.]